jgi:type IV secretion system protein VirB10
MMLLRRMAVLLVPATMLIADEATNVTSTEATVAPAPSASTAPAPSAATEKTYPVPIGTRLLLSMVNSVSTKHTEAGDRVYLETTFPISVNSRIVIPAGSYVMGTITNTKRPGKVKGKGEFFLRFDSLMLPNGVTRDFRGTLSNLDGRAS